MDDKKGVFSHVRHLFFMQKRRADLRATLVSLKEYQDVLIRIAELDRLLSKVPPEIEDMEKEWTSVKERIQALNTRETELQKKQSEQRINLAEAKEKSQKFEEDLHEVTNNKEYHAVLKEIDVAKKKVSSLEEEITTSTKELTEVQTNIEENTSLEKESKSKFESAMAQHKDSQADYEKERNAKNKERAKLAEGVPQRLMRQFERIASRRNGVGLSLCVGAICRACNVRVRQNIVDELRKFRGVINCESCKRILFFADGDE